MITENLSTLKIHKLTRDQYNRELEAGNIDENALYLTPDETTDLSMYATKEDLNDKADKNHTHDNYATTDYVDGNFALKSEIGNIELSGYVKKSDLEIHNTNIEAHNDIRDLISGLSTKVTNFLDVDEDTTDQLSEVLTLINNNKGTLESLTTTKVNVSDIINNLTTNVSNKPLSAAQGVEIKRLIDILQDELDSLESTVDGKADENHGHSNATATTSGFMSADDKILLDKYRTDGLGSFGGKTIPELKTAIENWISTVYNAPNAMACFSANISKVVEYWNYGDTTSTIPDGATITIELSALSIYGNTSKYTLLKLTSYYDKAVYYVALSDSVWSPIRRVMFADEIAGRASTVLTTTDNPSDSVWKYNIPFHRYATTDYKSLLTNNGLSYNTKEGTASSVGSSQLVLGNNVASGTAGNKGGTIALYGNNSGYTNIVPGNDTTSAISVYLPSSSGTLALTKDFLPITGGNLTGVLYTSGSIWAKGGAEIDIGVSYGTNKNLYLYGNSTSGVRGIWDTTKGSIIDVTDTEAIFKGSSTSVIRTDENTKAKLSYVNANKSSLGWGIRMTDSNSKPSYIYLTANAENEAPWMRLYGADGSTYTDVLTSANYSTWAAPKNHTHDNYTPYTELTDTTPTTAGWYRIAKTGAGIGNGSAVFQIVGVASGYHTTAIIAASTSYGVPASTNINVLNCAHFSNSAFTKARIVYHTTYSGNYAYLEIYKPYGVAISTKVKMIASNDWALSTPSTAGSVPSGYIVKEVELKNNTLTGDLTGNASTATSATTASSLSNAGTLTTSESINNFITGNRLQYALFQTQSDIGVGFASHDGMLLSIPWNSTNYGAQIAIDDNTTNPKIAIRAKNNSWGDWKILPFSDGTNASGTWGINITGSASKCNGTTLEYAGAISFSDAGSIAAWTNDGTKIKCLDKNVFALAGHSHTYLPTYDIKEAYLSDGFWNSFRTSVKGSSSNGTFISVLRSNYDLSGYTRAYGTGLSWGKDDTHGYLYLDYSYDYAVIGAGSSNKINWLKRLSFSDHTHNYAGSSSAGGAATSAIKADYLSTYAASHSTNDIIECLKAAFDSVPKSVGTAVRLERGSHNMAFGWFLNGYTKANAYGGWFISEYGTPSWVGVDNGTWHKSTFITSNNIGSQSVNYATSAGSATSASTASKWSTARTLSLTGAVTGSASIDGSGNVSLYTSNTHNHEGIHVKTTGDSMTGQLSIQTTIHNHDTPVAQALVINAGDGVPSGTTLTLSNMPGIGFHIGQVSWASIVFDGSFHFANSAFNGYQPINCGSVLSSGDVISNTWRSQAYGGGWYMTDSTWIRNYNDKPVLINYAGQGGLTLDNGTTNTATGVRVRRTDLGYEARIGMSAAGNIGIWCTNVSGSVTGMIYKKPTDATDTVYIPDRVVMSGAYGTSAPPQSGTLAKGMIYFQIVS